MIPYTYTFTLSDGTVSGAKSFNNTTVESTQTVTIASKKEYGGAESDAEWLIKSVKVGSADPTPVDSVFAAKAYNGTTEQLSQTVTWPEGGSAWEASPTAYWPQDAKLNFLTYANLPSGQSATITSTRVSTSHTVPATAADQTDILFGYYQGNGGNTGTAEIRFDHPLTAVRFLRGGIDDDLVIKSIRLAGVTKTGTATLDLNGQIEWSSVGDCDFTVSQTNDEGLALTDLAGFSVKLIGEPFLLIPQDLADYNVLVEVTFTNDIVASATISSGTWRAGCTNNFTLSK